MAPGMSSTSHLAKISNNTYATDPAFYTFFVPPPNRIVENEFVPQAGCTDSVVIDIATTVTINHFRRYYDGPIDSFTPNYVALADGSLVNPPLLDDIKAASVKLAVLSGLLTFFLINTFTATRYLYRGLVKNKILFYLLLFSQTFGLVAMTSMLVPFFSSAASCMIVAVFGRILVISSYAMLMTGILGFKAYRCLNNSLIIVIVLAALRVAIFTMLALDLSQLRSERRLSIGCVVNPEPTFLPIMVTLQFAEALFICLCFLRAAWKASRRPVDHGRLSIQPTLDLKPYSATASCIAVERQARRGWWDYEPPRSVPVNSRFPRPCHEIVRKLMTFQRDVDVVKTSQSGVETLSEPPRVGDKGLIATPSHRSSVVSRISKYMPRMALFKKLVHDELLHTALITALLLATAVLMLVGTACKFILEPPAWIALNWAVAATLTMHSFDRVVRRHEQEAILQQPSTWDPVYRAELEASRALRQERARRAGSTVSPTPRRLGWSDEPSVRIRSGMSIVVPSGGLSPQNYRNSPVSCSWSNSRGGRSLESGPLHTSGQDHSLDAFPRTSPTSDTQRSPSLWAASLGSPCSSEVHIVPHISVQSEGENWR